MSHPLPELPCLRIISVHQGIEWFWKWAHRLNLHLTPHAARVETCYTILRSPGCWWLACPVQRIAVNASYVHPAQVMVFPPGSLALERQRHPGLYHSYSRCQSWQSQVSFLHSFYFFHLSSSKSCCNLLCLPLSAFCLFLPRLDIHKQLLTRHILQVADNLPSPSRLNSSSTNSLRHCLHRLTPLSSAQTGTIFPISLYHCFFSFTNSTFWDPTLLYPISSTCCYRTWYFTHVSLFLL